MLFLTGSDEYNSVELGNNFELGTKYSDSMKLYFIDENGEKKPYKIIKELKTGIHEGKRIAHTIDPKTGYPVQHSILSSTVLAPSCAMADGYATSFMVLGLEKAKEVLSLHPELQAYFIYSDEKGENKVWYTPSLKQFFTE